jgi:hypothetical protein
MFTSVLQGGAGISQVLKAPKMGKQKYEVEHQQVKVQKKLISTAAYEKLRDVLMEES